MSILEKPPVSVEIGGKFYEIDADFRTMIKLEATIFDKGVTESQDIFAKEMMKYSDISYDDAMANAKYFEAMDVFYKGKIPDDLEGAMEKLLWFYSCGKTEKRRKSIKKPVFDFKVDFDYINAGFMQDYKIDLFDIGFLHWWKFMSLFSALHDDCKICEIIGWRSADTKGMDKEQKKRIKEMQRTYALPDAKTEEEQKIEDDVTNALLNGGDLTGIL